MKEELKVTSPEEYAEKARQASTEESMGFLHKLKKTGAVVRLRHVDMEALAIVGSLPMSLVAAAMRTAKSEMQIDKNPTPEDVEEGNKTLIFIRQLVTENCIDPQIRYEEGVGVFFVGANGKPVARVDKDDFMEMFAVVSGEEGADGLEKFRNRQTRRASAAKSRRKTLRTGSAPVEDEGQPAQA